MNELNLEKTFADISKMKVAVIGDIMLDTYLWGTVERISPEAPVPVVSLVKNEKRIGGAGNVALNARKLGANVAVITLIGIDEGGNEVKQLLQDGGIDTRFIITSRKRITTNKTRIISRNQQMLRVDNEITNDLEADDEEKLMGIIERYLQTEKPDIIILEDYNKGIFTQRIIRETMQLCDKAGVIVTVDPKRKNFFEFNGATIFKPNLSEVVNALNLLPEQASEEWLSRLHVLLSEQLQHTYSLITLSEKGIFFGAKGKEAIIPGHKREIADVSGAGDTVIAVASLAYAATKDIAFAAQLANIAGGLVCEEVGTVPVSVDKLLQEAEKILGDSLLSEKEKKKVTATQS